MMFARPPAALAAAALVAVLVAMGVGSAPAATSGTVVGATVLSATSINSSTCSAGATAATEFGSILPGSNAITTADCDVRFGSSNNTAQLRLHQTDRRGTGMWMPSVGALDVTFDGPTGVGNGRFIDPIGAAADTPTAVAMQPDGKLVVAGTCSNGANNDFCLARYLPTGAIDTTFDGPSGSADGRFLDPIGAANDQVAAIALQPDGKIVVVGQCEGNDWDHCVARYLPSGAHDLSFDGPAGTANGKFLEQVADTVDKGMSVALLEDGRIVVSGACGWVWWQHDFCLARYMPDGSRDLTLDGPSGTGDGEVKTLLTGQDDYGMKLQVLPDGRMLVGGDCWNNALSTMVLCFMRFNADATLDATFDGPSGTGNGMFLLPLQTSTFERFADMRLLPDGRAVVAGRCGVDDNVHDLCLFRLLANGMLDPTFDGPGGAGNGAFVVSITTGTDRAGALEVQPDGRYLVAGGCHGGTDEDLCLARFETDGAWDLRFDGPSNGNGRFAVPVGTGDDRGLALAPRDDGRYVVAGSCAGATNADACLLGIQQGGSISQYVTGGGSDTDWASAGTTSMFGACLRAVSGGAAATWAAAGTCTMTDGATWHSIPEGSEQVATTNALEPDPVDATASLRFGMRPAESQVPGPYVAPITFEVLAP